MAGKRSAGLLVYRTRAGATEVLLAHMGGPFWSRRDAGAWSIPKGEYDDIEEPRAAAFREFREELGLAPPAGDVIALGDVRQSGGKVVTAWAVAGDVDPDAIDPGTFEMEWPRGSGRIREFPEVDRVAWFGLDEAVEKIVAGQRDLLERFRERLDS
ncbi:NUDIX domain-containing protein [Haloechinothrix salitolerans]|uniref:NUDIX domain-containing protein n=1 Tax=Haloechinothrix salitolerans TaxID=926830 RepID=A0ABW2C356_9PSEU